MSLYEEVIHQIARRTRCDRQTAINGAGEVENINEYGEYFVLSNKVFKSAGVVEYLTPAGKIRFFMDAKKLSCGSF